MGILDNIFGQDAARAAWQARQAAGMNQQRNFYQNQDLSQQQMNQQRQSQSYRQIEERVHSIMTGISCDPVPAPRKVIKLDDKTDLIL